MKILQLFACFTTTELKTLSKSYPDDTSLKKFLCDHLARVTHEEVERIKEEEFKTIGLLSQEQKL